MPTQAGILTVSLDFELYWGICDKVDLQTSAARLLGARAAIPCLLDMFARSGVHVTWATVGFLFFDEKDELLAHMPALKPGYRDQRLSPYQHVHGIGPNERKDPFHYARSLIRRIVQFPGQEIGTHTFSHYYCLERGQTLQEFRADLNAAYLAAQRIGIELKSLVFPRNQWRPDYLDPCAEIGIRAFRGNEASWLYRPESGREGLVKRACRLADSYINVSGHLQQRPVSTGSGLFNVPSSRFLRPFSRRFAPLSPLHVRRICKGMDHAAKHGFLYHLWWHPHNFGAHREENMSALGSVLNHFQKLSREHGMISRSMGEAVPADGESPMRAVRRAGPLTSPLFRPAIAISNGKE